MGEQGAALQKYNQELVKCIEQLKLKREELSIEIKQDEAIKTNMEEELRQLQCKLGDFNDKLKKKKDILEACEKSIKESETAFMKILESSQVLLSKVLKESEELLLGDESEG